MALGNSSAQSEARRPEVVAVRSAMKNGEVSAKKAIDNDPTLSAFLRNPDFVKAMDREISEQLDNAASEGTAGNGGTTFEPETMYFSIGNKVYAMQPPSIDVEYDTEDESFDHAFGTEEAHSNVVTGASVNDFDDLIDQSTIREVGADELKSLNLGPYSRMGDKIEMPEPNGFSALVPIRESWDYALAYQGFKPKMGENPTVAEITPPTTDAANAAMKAYETSTGTKEEKSALFVEWQKASQKYRNDAYYKFSAGGYRFCSKYEAEQALEKHLGASRFFELHKDKSLKMPD